MIRWCIKLRRLTAWCRRVDNRYRWFNLRKCLDPSGEQLASDDFRKRISLLFLPLSFFSSSDYISFQKVKIWRPVCPVNQWSLFVVWMQSRPKEKCLSTTDFVPLTVSSKLECFCFRLTICWILTFMCVLSAQRSRLIVTSTLIYRVWLSQTLGELGFPFLVRYSSSIMIGDFNYEHC